MGQAKKTDYSIRSEAFRVCDIPERLRPREEMERRGVEGISDAAALAIILRGGARGINVVDLASALLTHYGSLTELGKAPVEELASVKGIGRVKAQVLKAALDLPRRAGLETVRSRHSVKSPEDAARLLRETARALDQEKFWAILLDAKNCLKGSPMEITEGLLDASLVHPREGFRPAIRAACAAVVLAHNHPSGDPTPSAEDIRITRQLINAGRIVDIRVLDHVIIGKALSADGRDFLSMREAGIVEFAE